MAIGIIHPEGAMPKPRKFIITETDEFLTSHGGMAMIGMLAERSGLRERVSQVTPDKKNGSISTADALLTMTGLFCLAKPDFDGVEQFREDDYFQEMSWTESCSFRGYTAAANGRNGPDRSKCSPLRFGVAVEKSTPRKPPALDRIFRLMLMYLLLITVDLIRKA